MGPSRANMITAATVSSVASTSQRSGQFATKAKGWVMFAMARPSSAFPFRFGVEGRQHRLHLLALALRAGRVGGGMLGHMLDVVEDMSAILASIFIGGHGDLLLSGVG